MTAVCTSTTFALFSAQRLVSQFISIECLCSVWDGALSAIVLAQLMWQANHSSDTWLLQFLPLYVIKFGHTNKFQLEV